MADVGVVIRDGRKADFSRLREIALASKAHWGYDLAEVEKWVETGGFDAETLSTRLVYVAESDGEPVGWAALIPRGEVGWLEDLWVEPSWIGRGVGSRLFRHVEQRARELGARRLEWEAEPHALGFYERMGGSYVRDSETVEWERRLEILGLTL